MIFPNATMREQLSQSPVRTLVQECCEPYHIVCIVLYIAYHAGRHATCGPALTHDDIVRGSTRRQLGATNTYAYASPTCLHRRVVACMYMWHIGTGPVMFTHIDQCQSLWRHRRRRGRRRTTEISAAQHARGAFFMRHDDDWRAFILNYTTYIYSFI